jgi:hypothetical protein
LLFSSSETQVLIVASGIGASIGVLLSSHWALANELGTTGREGQHMGLVTLASVIGAAAAKALGPGVDLLNLTAEGLGYDALLVGGAALFILGALILLPVKASLAEMPLPEDAPHQTAT